MSEQLELFEVPSAERDNVTVVDFAGRVVVSYPTEEEQ